MCLVTVIIPTFNAGRYLRPAVDSVLSQTHRDLEILLIDDGSTDTAVDDLERSASDGRLRIIRQSNAGKPTVMNRAIAMARGEFYLVQDADDVSYPRRVERLVAAMRANPEVAAVFSGHDLILGERTVAPTGRSKSVEQCRADIGRMAMPAHDPTAMYRLSMVRAIEFEPSLLQGEGHDYLLRVGERFPMMVLGECLYSYRVNWASLTRSDPVRRQQFVEQVLRRACARRGIDYEAWWAAQQKRRRWRRRSKASERDNDMAAHFVASARDLRDANRRFEAIRSGLQCFWLHPLDPYYLKALAIAVSPVRLPSNSH